MVHEKKRIRSLFSWREYILNFIFISFILTINVYLLLHGVKGINRESFGDSALVVLGNLMFLAFLHTLVLSLIRRRTMATPVKRILEATDRIAAGDYSVRIERIHKNDKEYNEFDLIIDNFNLMADELSNTEILRSDFISNVSHELKSPLASIQNYSVLLQDPALTSEKRIEYSKEIQVSTARFAALITNILKLNKLENQSIFIADERINISEQLCSVMLEHESVWEKKGIEIETDIEQDVYINGDYELLSIVWNNLISNALKFTEKGGRVKLSLKPSGDIVRVEVEDSGCGMTDEEMKRIFEKFYQGDTSHSTAGNGLGLPLVKRVMDIVGGDISVESEKGKGSRFTVSLCSPEVSRDGSH